MKKISTLLMSALVALSGCSSNNNDSKDDPIMPPDPVAMTKVQIIHASPDAPKVNLTLDGTQIAADVDYSVATAFAEITAGAHTAEVDAILADGSTIEAFDDVAASLEADLIYSILAVGKVAEIEPLILTREDTEVMSTDLRAQIVHAAPNAPMVDIYVTAADAALMQSAPLGTASFKDSLDPVTVPSGEYQIRITAAGDSSAVVFDSGAIDIAGGSDLLIAAVENVTPGAQPVNLLIVNQDGASLLQDVATPAEVRVVHASPDAPAVDVVANDNFASPLISDLAFTEVAGYVDLPADSYNVKVVPNGATDPVVIDADLALEAGTAYTVIAAGLLADIEPVVLTADNRRVATEAKLRVIHGSPAATQVDVYLVAAGDSIDNAEPVLANIPFKADSDFLSVPAGDYDVVVTPTGTKTAAIGPATISLTAGGLYTAIAKDNQGGGAPLGLILLDDFVTP